jgi:hypothetical protein
VVARVRFCEWPFRSITLAAHFLQTLLNVVCLKNLRFNLFRCGVWVNYNVNDIATKLQDANSSTNLRMFSRYPKYAVLRTSACETDFHVCLRVVYSQTCRSTFLASFESPAYWPRSVPVAHLPRPAPWNRYSASELREALSEMQHPTVGGSPRHQPFNHQSVYHSHVAQVVIGTLTYGGARFEEHAGRGLFIAQRERSTSAISELVFI